MKKSNLAAIFVLLLFSMAGCQHERTSTMVSVGGEVRRIKTRNRYTLLTFKQRGHGANADVARENVYVPQSSNDDLKKFQPDVFSDDGIRFTCESARLCEDDRYGWTTVFPYLTTLMILPQCRTISNGSRNTVDVLDNPDARATFDSHARYDMALGLTPLSWFFYLGDAAPLDGNETYTTISEHTISTPFFGFGAKSRGWLDAGMAYAMAMTLKKMEDDGLIDESRGRQAGLSSVQVSSAGDKFEIVDFRREGDDGWRYSFKLRRRDRKGISLRESHEVQKILKTMIRADYASSFPDVAAGVLVVDFLEFSLRDDEINGKAEVLALTAESLRYDSNTRTGVMRVRIGANQFNEARRYAIRNIESLVRDKNIVLDGRDIPPAAKFFLLGESLKGDVLEISFKTE